MVLIITIQEYHGVSVGEELFNYIVFTYSVGKFDLSRFIWAAFYAMFNRNTYLNDVCM